MLMSEIPYERLKQLFQAERKFKEGNVRPPPPATLEEASTLAHLMLTIMHADRCEDFELGKFSGWPEENNFKPYWEYDDGPDERFGDV